uniref:Immunoglobulin superfamily member 22-like n=1 Tax=Phallusia mammillata TaxID=59560 RepID=A0A6F9DFQ2_9ASCI|nr:immunoglobulin superfamily member 22-like [Phallusia mammillata]
MATGQLKEFRQPIEEEGESFPKFLKPVVDGNAKEGERLVFSCTVEGSPFPKVSWKKGQWLQLDDGGRYEVKANPGSGICTMAIKKTRVADMGKYRVVVTNDCGEITCPFQVKIQKSNENVTNFKAQLKHREVKQKKKQTAEEREKEVLEILKTAEPKDYERICMEYGFYDFRHILHKLKNIKKVDVEAPEFEAAKVLKALRHVTINDEGTAVFEIHLENVSPNRQMMWYKDGEIVQIPGAEKRHELRRIGNVFQLIIRNANAEDAGTYTLDIGGEKFDAILTIKEQPLSFTSELISQSARVHGRCVFECCVSRRGQKITWLKNGQPLKVRGTTGRLQEVTEGKTHKLIITELDMKDTGSYTAKLGDMMSSADLKVTAAPIRFRHRLVNTEVKEKSTATFECSVSSKEVQPVWTVNGEVVKNGGRYTIKSGDIHSLSFKKVSLSDHKAVVKVSFGEATSTAELQVNAKPIKVVSKMQDAKCRAGKPAEFSCEIDDTDADAEVQWFKDDKPIEASSKFEMTKIRGKYTLKVKNVQTKDEGLYQFQIRGVRSEAHLVCSDPPTVDNAFLERLRKNPLKFKAGTKAKIEIPFTGKNPTGVQWTNGRVTLVERGRMHMENTNKTATLCVDNCSVKDSGVYEVTIANESGDITVEVPVKIVDKPAAPSGEIAFSDIKANEVTMSWNPPIDDSTPVEEYVIEVKDSRGQWKQLAKVPSDKTEFTAKGLKEGESYQFRVRSANEEGKSEPLESQPVSPAAPDEPPYIDPKVIERLEKTPLVVKAGETATIKIPCKGNPPPSAAWMHDGDEVLPVKHHRATKGSSMNEVTLKIVKCQGSDSGEYEARIFNNIGGVVVKTKLKVMDVADMSQTKINFDKITPQEVAISWEKPQQDGGSPVKSYVVERCEAGKENWSKVSEVKGTNFRTSSCQPGVEYLFRVKAVNAQGESQPVVSAPVTCGAAEVAPSVDAQVLNALQQKPLKFKAGQTGRIKIPIKGGHPPPVITWEKDGKPLEGKFEYWNKLKRKH